MMRPCVPRISESGQPAGFRSRPQNSFENGLSFILLVPHDFSISSGDLACFIRATNETPL